MFRNFEEAARSVPPGQPIGYDNEDAAAFYRERLGRVGHDDYPALLWLARALQTSRSLVEIGGHVGVAYYSYERLIGYPEGLTWTILDTPAVAEAGARLARERGRHGVRFTSDFAEVEGGDILFAAGSLQYLPGPLLPERVHGMRLRPRHILVNKTPVTDGDGYVTLQSIGVAYCPYRVHSRRELVEPLLSMGYRLVDAWRKERRLEIPGHPERTLDHYSGFYLVDSR